MRRSQTGQARQDSSQEQPSSPSDSVAQVEPYGREQTSSSQGFLPVLSNRRFLILWSGQVFSQLADKVYLVLMIALIASHFQRSDQTISGWVSVIMIAFTIPAVLFGSLAGVYVDRWSKKVVLVATNLLRGLLVMVVPLLLSLSQDWGSFLTLPIGFWMLLVVTFLVSTLTQFFAPAEQTAIPLLVQHRHLLPANSLYTTTMMASMIVGFAVGEPLLALTEKLAAVLGMTWDFSKELVVGGAYAAAGLLLLLLRTDENTDAADRETPHVFQDIWDGVVYLRQNHRVRNALIQLVILFSVFAALAVLAVRLAETIPGLKSSQFGFLLAASGVGMAGGAGFLGNWGQQFSRTKLSLYGSFGIAGSLVGLSLFTQQLWMTFLMTTLLGIFAAFVGVPMQTTIQAETPEQMRGKVFGLQNNTINIALSLPLALASVAETFLGLRSVFLGLAAIVVAGGLLTWYISRTGVVISTIADE
ncbi:MAG: arabinose efflux permease [Cyanobacteria bacterium SW_12_48_29]|nr:MAG: arabinose efflux permease [Cyanobacteria bacterium QS_3_48_167]PSP03738.1 MAG: arabinose efflux permease [Cyanobacteria bacterium SW_12_48_29]